MDLYEYELPPADRFGAEVGLGRTLFDRIVDMEFAPVAYLAGGTLLLTVAFYSRRQIVARGWRPAFRLALMAGNIGGALYVLFVLLAETPMYQWRRIDYILPIVALGFLPFINFLYLSAEWMPDASRLVRLWRLWLETREAELNARLQRARDPHAPPF